MKPATVLQEFEQIAEDWGIRIMQKKVIIAGLLFIGKETYYCC